MEHRRLDDFRECPECDKPVMGPTALLAHLEFSHDIDDPIGYLLELQAPDEPRRWSLRRRPRVAAPTAAPAPTPAPEPERSREPVPVRMPAWDPAFESVPASTPAPTARVEPTPPPPPAPEVVPNGFDHGADESHRESHDEAHEESAEEAIAAAYATDLLGSDEPDLSIADFWVDDDVAPSPRDAWVDDLPERRARREQQSIWRRNRLPVIAGAAAGVLLVVFVLGSVFTSGGGGAVTTLSDDGIDGEMTVDGFRLPFVREADVEACTPGIDGTNQYELSLRLTGARDVVLAGESFPDESGDAQHVIPHQGPAKTYVDHISVEDAEGTAYRVEIVPPVYLTPC